MSSSDRFPRRRYPKVLVLVVLAWMLVLAWWLWWSAGATGGAPVEVELMFIGVATILGFPSSLMALAVIYLAGELVDAAHAGYPYAVIGYWLVFLACSLLQWTGILWWLDRRQAARSARS